MSRWLRWLVICALVITPSAFAFAQTETPEPTLAPTADLRGGLPVGTVIMSASVLGVDSSPGWLYCDGSLVQIDDYPDLYQVIGNFYGGSFEDGTFALPDMRGRVPMGVGWGIGLDGDYILGQMFGSESHTLTITEMPSHNHTIADPGHVHTIINRSGVPTNRHSGVAGANPSNAENTAGTTNSSTANTTTSSATGITVNSTGGGQAFGLLQPSFVLHFVIWSGTDPMVLASPSEIELTVVVNFPTHTPTPTLTPSATFTPGPSPTATATVTPTPNFISYSTYSGQDAALVYQLTAGDVTIILLLAGVLCALLVIIFMKYREPTNDVG